MVPNFQPYSNDVGVLMLTSFLCIMVMMILMIDCLYLLLGATYYVISLYIKLLHTRLCEDARSEKWIHGTYKE